MTTIKEQIMAVAIYESVPEEEWVSLSEQRVRNSIPNADTLPARAAGYNWGRRDENARLLPLINALAEQSKAVEDIMWINKCRCSKEYTSRGKHEPNAFCGELDLVSEALAKLKVILEGK